MSFGRYFCIAIFGILLFLMARPAVKSASAMEDLHWETVTAEGGNVGRYNTTGTLAFDSDGYPGFATHKGGDDYVRYWKWNGSSWTWETIWYNFASNENGYGASLAYDSSDKPHVAVRVDDGTSDKYLYFRRDGNQNLGTCSGGTQDSDWGCEVIATAPTDVHYAYTSIQIMPASPFTVSMAYTGSNNDLHYATRVDCNKVDCCTDTNWTCEQVDGTDYGLVPTLQFDSSNEPHIAYRYQTGTSHSIRFARRNGSHTGCSGADDDEWECDTIISDTPYDGTYPYKLPADLALDSSGNPVVSIYGDDANELSLCDSSDGGDTWSCSLLYSGTNHGKNATIAITDEDLVYVAWVYATNDLYMAIPNPDGDGTGCAGGVTDWDCGAVHTTSLSGQYTCVAFYGGSDARHVGVVHWNGSGYDMMYTHAPTIDVKINEIQYDPSEDATVDTDTSSDVENCPGAPIDLAEWTPGSAASTTIAGNTTSASDDINESLAYSCWSGNDTREHVYRFVPPVNLDLQIDTIGSGYDTKLAVVSPCGTGKSSCIFNDDYSGTDSGWNCQTFTGGTTYSIIVSGAAGKYGSYNLNLDECGTASGSDTNGDDEWVELYVARSGNLADVQFTTNDGETAFDLPTVDVDRGEYVVVAVGSGTDDTTGPQYVVNWGEKVERLDNTGDDVSVLIEPWSAAAECHNYVSYGIETGGAIDDPGSGCDFDGTYPSCVTCNTNPVSAAENYSVSLGPDGKTGDVVANWEQSGAAGDPATYGPKTFGITNMAAPTPARLAGMWTEPGAAGGVLISWTTLSEIETLATRPVRWTGSDWVPVCEWHMASRNSFFGTHMTAFDETGFDGDLYAIEEIDNAGTRRIVPAPALQPQAPMVKTLAPLRKGMANSTRPVPRHVPAAPDKCRLEADGPGWVNVTSETLLEMCPETESWSEIRIQKLGRTIPGNWTGDGLEFFATAPSNRYERHEIYELSNGPGHSFGETDGAPLDYGEDVYALPLTVRFEQERVYHIGSTEWDHFYWDFFGTGLPLEVTLESGGEVERLLVHVAGVTEGIHGLEAWLGTTFIGRGSFEGRVAATVEFWLDGLNIPPGTPLELHATGPGELDYQYLGAVEMDVQKTLRCGMDLAVPNNFEGTLNVECDFEDVTAYDVTDPRKPVRLVGMESEPQAEGTLARIGLAPSESVRTIRVVETGTSVTTQLFPTVPMDTPTDVDYLVISDPALQKGIAPLLAHREQQGLKTAVVGMDAVRDGHGHGYNDPAAVSNFLSDLSEKGVLPRYLLLVGAATVDPRGYLGTGAKNSVPTGFATKAFYEYEMPSDDELIPPALRSKIAVGRIPARSLETLEVYVDKLLAFEGNKAGRALLLRDGTDPTLFTPIADELYKEHLEHSPIDTKIESVGAGTFVSEALAPYVGQTLDLLIYAGHGQLQGWGTHLGLADLATFPEVVWTLGVSLDCYDGHFANPNGETLAWEMLLLEGRGPLTAYVPGTVVAPGEHLWAGKALMHQIKGEAPSTVGYVVLQAENEMRGMGGVQANLASGFNLLGDPATRWPGFPASAVPDGQTGTDDTDTGNDDGFDAADHSTENCNCRAPGAPTPGAPTPGVPAPGAPQNILTLLFKLIP